MTNYDDDYQRMLDELAQKAEQGRKEIADGDKELEELLEESDKRILEQLRNT